MERVSCRPAAVRFDKERSAFAVNLPSGGGEFYLQAAAVRRADTRCVHVCLIYAMLGTCYCKLSPNSTDCFMRIETIAIMYFSSHKRLH